MGHVWYTLYNPAKVIAAEERVVIIYIYIYSQETMIFWPLCIEPSLSNDKKTCFT